MADCRLLSAVIASYSLLPSTALLIGLAEDGLPVLLNLQDHALGPTLVAADAGAGKTRLLQTIARGIEHLHDPVRVHFAVITEHPNEWAAFEGSEHCHGVFPFHHALATGLLHCAALGESAGSVSGRALVLLTDGYEALASDGDLRDSAGAILQSPSPRGVASIVTLDTKVSQLPAAWLEVFRVRLFGYVRDRRTAGILGGSEGAVLGGLQPPHQFATQENGNWLAFWLPEID